MSSRPNRPPAITLGEGETESIGNLCQGRGTDRHRHQGLRVADEIDKPITVIPMAINLLGIYSSASEDEDNSLDLHPDYSICPIAPRPRPIPRFPDDKLLFLLRTFFVPRRPNIAGRQGYRRIWRSLRRCIPRSPPAGHSVVNNIQRLGRIPEGQEHLFKTASRWPKSDLRCRNRGSCWPTSRLIHMTLRQVRTILNAMVS